MMGSTILQRLGVVAAVTLTGLVGVTTSSAASAHAAETGAFEASATVRGTYTLRNYWGDALADEGSWKPYVFRPGVFWSDKVTAFGAGRGAIEEWIISDAPGYHPRVQLKNGATGRCLSWIYKNGDPATPRAVTKPCDFEADNRQLWSYERVAAENRELVGLHSIDGGHATKGDGDVWVAENGPPAVWGFTRVA
jgi:hypothetical protein